MPVVRKGVIYHDIRIRDFSIYFGIVDEVIAGKKRVRNWSFDAIGCKSKLRMPVFVPQLAPYKLILLFP
jgi:hypothetical protein